jgi:hypothetical protein
MVNDPNPALRAEMQAAVDAVKPEIRGLEDFSSISKGSALSAVITELTVRQRRLELLVAILAALDAVVIALDNLYADGYPKFPPNIGTQDVFAEIQAEEADLKLAAELFRGGAVGIGLDVANAIHTPQKIPKS